MKGLSIVIEGIDGSGKTTQVEQLVSRLNAFGRKAFYAKSPNGSAAAEKIRALAEEPQVTPTAEMAAFLFSNAIFCEEVIVPRLANGEIAVLDRWTGSFLSYFHALSNFPYGFLEAMNACLMKGFSADKVIIIDVPTEIAVKRIKMKNKLSRYDKKSPEDIEKQRYAFLELAQRHGWLLIDGSCSIETVGEDIWSLIKPLL